MVHRDINYQGSADNKCNRVADSSWSVENASKTQDAEQDSTGPYACKDDPTDLVTHMVISWS